MLIDSDVLIWFLRAHPKATVRLALLPQWRISIVTYMEVAQGCHTKAELVQTKNGLAIRDTEVISVSPTIGQLAADLIDSWAHSHGLRLADALIAATALELNTPLLTCNTKHFKHIPGLNIESFLP
jgi:predicted nucleic acid-binding protein